MKKVLNGAELAAFIKERQAKQVRNLKQQYGVLPRLVVLMSQHATEASNAYVRMKARYADDIGVVCDINIEAENELAECIDRCNVDSKIHGIIVQLPLLNNSQTDEICNIIDSKKDVDGLSEHAEFASATAEAIDWLLAGYNIGLAGKTCVIVGHGKLVGKPLATLWRGQGHDVKVIDVDTPQAQSILRNADVIVSATGVPGRVTSADVKSGAIIIDAGTATENGELVGDIDASVRLRDDITITPIRGGVGPLTIAVLFDHVIQAALAVGMATRDKTS